jgi:hypothetical protein
MSVARNNAAVYSLFLVVSVFILLLTGCEDPNSLSGSFTDPGTEVQDTVLSVSNIGTDSFITFSGELSSFSIGQFNDPIFGNVTATSLIKPRLPNVTPSQKLSENIEMNLRMVIDSTNNANIYGDTASIAQFDLIEIDELWRSRSWKFDDEIQLSQNQVGSFEIDQATDSIEVALNPEWASRYRAFYNAISANRDSLYRYDFKGLAIVPRNESKIIPFSFDDAQFEVIDNEDSDTSSVTLSQWAFSIERVNPSTVPSGSSKSISTYEEVLKFDMNLSQDDLGTANISKVELVVFQNNELLESSLSQVSATAKRPEISTANLFLSNPRNLPDLFRSGNPIATATYNETTGSYRFDITRFTNSVLVDGVDEGNSFYITLGSNDGIIKSGLLYNNEAPEDKRPKLIVTFINKES